MFYFVVERKAGVWGWQNKGNRHCKCRKILQRQVKKNTVKCGQMVILDNLYKQTM